MCFPAVDAAPFVADRLTTSTNAIEQSVIRTPHIGIVSRPIVSYVAHKPGGELKKLSSIIPAAQCASSSSLELIATSSSSFTTLASQTPTGTDVAAASCGLVKPIEPAGWCQQETTFGSFGNHQISNLVTSPSEQQLGDGDLVDPSIEKMDRLLDEVLADLSHSIPNFGLDNHESSITTNTNQLDFYSSNIMNDNNNNININLLNENVQLDTSTTGMTTFELDLNVFDLMTDSLI